MCPQLLGATLDGDDGVIFVSAEPSCAAFTHLRPLTGVLLEDDGQETNLVWIQ